MENPSLLSRRRLLAVGLALGLLALAWLARDSLWLVAEAASAEAARLAAECFKG